MRPARESGLHQRREAGLDATRAETMDQRQPARLVVGIERPRELDQFLGLDRGTDLHPDRIGNPAEILHMHPPRQRVRSPIQGK